MAIKQLTDRAGPRLDAGAKGPLVAGKRLQGQYAPVDVARRRCPACSSAAFLSLTNLYVGMKTGWTLGVGITSVILAFALFKVLQKIGLGREFTLLENNCMQSIATAAGYMTSPLIASLAAYMMITHDGGPHA